MSRNLRILHAVAAATHFGQAGALTYLVSKDAPGAVQWPITRLGWKRVIPEKTREFYLGTLLPVFPFLSSVNHFVAAVDGDWYKGVLEKKVNWLRWAEYSISAGVMVFLIAILAGVTEVRTLVSLMILNVSLQMMGLMIEKRKSEGATRGELSALLMIAWGIFAAMWTQLIISFYTVTSETRDPPKIIFSIIWTMFTLFSSFGTAQSLYCYDIISFEAYEGAFIGLSLFSKSLLSWLVYGGIISADARFEEK